MESIESDPQEIQQDLEKDIPEYESQLKQVEKNLSEVVDLVENVEDKPAPQHSADQESTSCLIGCCRICARVYETMISIFDETGMEMELEKKINNYLPITVSRNDKFPLQLCLVCIAKLNVTHDLITSCMGSKINFKYIKGHNSSEKQED